MSVSDTAQKANRLFEAGKVAEVPMARVFVVEGDDSTYQIVLSADGDRAWCSCPSLAACSHVGAVLLQAGLVVVS